MGSSICIVLLYLFCTFPFSPLVPIFLIHPVDEVLDSDYLSESKDHFNSSVDNGADLIYNMQGNRVIALS